MFFADSVFVGIEPSSKKSFTYAVLDRGLNLIALADGDMEAVTAFLAGQQAAVAAVNSPSGLNRELVREKKKELFKSQKTRAGYRLAEFELRARGIHASGTPSVASACPSWMQAGFTLYRKLEKMGFKKYPTDGAEFQVFETHSLADFCILAGTIALPKTSLEGRLQRQLLLYEHGVQLKDPMEFFEEITRHKMIRGLWPMELLYSPGQLDALVAAFTAWMSIQRPGEVTFVGDEKEGRILLPVKELKDRYSA